MDPSEVASLDEPHRDVQPPLVLAGVEDRDDVGMVDRRRMSRLADEAIAKAAAPASVEHDLECHDPARRATFRRAVDDAHPAAPHHVIETIRPELRVQPHPRLVIAARARISNVVAGFSVHDPRRR